MFEYQLGVLVSAVRVDEDQEISRSVRRCLGHPEVDGLNQLVSLIAARNLELLESYLAMLAPFGIFNQDVFS